MFAPAPCAIMPLIVGGRRARPHRQIRHGHRLHLRAPLPLGVHLLYSRLTEEFVSPVVWPKCATTFSIVAAEVLVGNA